MGFGNFGTCDLTVQFQSAECQEHGENSLDEWLRMFHAASMKKKLKDLSRCSHVSKRATYQNAKARSINWDFANITKKGYGSIECTSALKSSLVARGVPCSCLQIGQFLGQLPPSDRM